MEIITVIVALIIILALGCLMFMTIDKLSKDTLNQIKRSATSIMSEYDAILENKRQELLELSKKQKHNRDDIYITSSDNDKTYHSTLNLQKDKQLDSADVYRILHNEYNFDAVKTAKEILSNLPSVDNEVKLIENIFSKINKETFAILDTLSHEDQLLALKDVLTNEEFELVSNIGQFGIKLYNELENKLTKKERVVFYVSSEKMKQDLKNELNIDAILSKDLVEGMDVIVNDKVYKYGIERSELQ